MADTRKGEFALRLGGQTYTLFVGTRALREFQEHFATPDAAPSIESLMAQVFAFRVKYVCAFLWFGLQRHHPELTLDSVDDLLDQAEPEEVKTLLGNLGVTTQPAAEDLADLGVNGSRPTEAAPATRQSRRRAARGGAASTSQPDVPA